jgi:hypothetical protein
LPDLNSSDIVQRVRDLLGDHPYETTSTTTTTSTSVNVGDNTRWDEGAIGEWQTGTVGFEQFYVTNASANPLIVVRGYDGTTAETHTSGDRVLRIDGPGFAGRKVQQAINQTVLDVWPFVWKTGSISLTWAPTTTKWYNLDALTLGIVKVTQQTNTTIPDVGVFKDRYFGHGKSYITQRALPTGLVASGNGITFPLGVYDPRSSGANTIFVTDIRAITGTADIVDSGDLPVAEAVTYGAVARLLRAKEVARISYGAPIEAVQTAGVGARIQLAQYYETQFRNRLEALSFRLRQLYNPDQIWR